MAELPSSLSVEIGEIKGSVQALTDNVGRMHTDIGKAFERMTTILQEVSRIEERMAQTLEERKRMAERIEQLDMKIQDAIDLISEQKDIHETQLNQVKEELTKKIDTLNIDEDTVELLNKSAPILKVFSDCSEDSKKIVRKALIALVLSGLTFLGLLLLLGAKSWVVEKLVPILKSGMTGTIK
jgi:chromosome segregation ATPase